MGELAPTLACLTVALLLSAAYTDEEQGRAGGTCFFDYPWRDSSPGPYRRQCPDSPCPIHGRSHCSASDGAVAPDEMKGKDGKDGGAKMSYTAADPDVVMIWETGGVVVAAGPTGSKVVRSRTVTPGSDQTGRMVGLPVVRGWRQNAWADVARETEQVDCCYDGLAANRLGSLVAEADSSMRSTALELAYW